MNLKETQVDNLTKHIQLNENTALAKKFIRLLSSYKKIQTDFLANPREKKKRQSA